jgi:murein DD-endopeptidase MepM/ murein hydrolase activator NlpD
MDKSRFENIIQEHRHLLHAVVPFNREKDSLVYLDFSERNSGLTDDLLKDTSVFTNYISQVMQQAGARYGIGGYAEHRAIYRFSRVFDGSDKNEEPRRLHLGMDIWGKPHTAVMSPLDGIVHSFAFNNKPGDYGPTVILTHQLEHYAFYTLYGHLSLSSIKNLREGDRIGAGEVFAEFGIPVENVGWPPHLHFQVILDIGNNKGDYPGVCKFSEREQWLANSPDPDLILQMNHYINA